MTPCDEMAQDIAAKARMPGWWQYARAQARECEADDSGVYVGLLAKVRALLGDFRPSPEEAREWHIDLSLEERIALAAQERQGLRKASVDVLPALKDGDSHYWRSTSRAENV